jgi:hypothetical protein
MKADTNAKQHPTEADQEDDMHSNEQIHWKIAQMRHQEDLRRAEEMRSLEESRSSNVKVLPTIPWMLLFASIIVDRVIQ